MPLYVQVCAGPTAAEARPMLATSDREVVWRTMHAILARAAAEDPPLLRVEIVPPSSESPAGEVEPCAAS